MSNEERREYSRLDNIFNVRIAKKIREEYIRSAITIGKALNISGSGMLLSIPQELQPGEILRLTFLKPNSFEFFESMGRVVHITNCPDSNYILGINFFYLTKSEKDRLHYYINLTD